MHACMYTEYREEIDYNKLESIPPFQMLCWGVRDMKHYQLQKVDSPLVELECGGTVLRSKHIKDASKNPNFPEPILTIDVVRTCPDHLMYLVMSPCLIGVIVNL